MNISVDAVQRQWFLLFSTKPSAQDHREKSYKSPYLSAQRLYCKLIINGESDIRCSSDIEIAYEPNG